MDCRQPGAVTREDLIAFVDGEALPSVAEHVGACPHCAAEAEAYAAHQGTLRRRLSRVACPAPHTLGEFELGLLQPEDRLSIVAHLVDCPHCRHELDMLRAFLATELPPPTSTASGVQRIVATIFAQLAPAPSLAGLRGGQAETARTYAAGDYRLTVGPGLEARGGGSAGLTGLIWRESGEPERSLRGSASLLDASGSTQVVDVDPLGNFAFAAVEPGTYQLEVALEDQRIVIDHLSIGP